MNNLIDISIKEDEFLSEDDSYTGENDLNHYINNLERSLLERGLTEEEQFEETLSDFNTLKHIDIETDMQIWKLIDRNDKLSQTIEYLQYDNKKLSQAINDLQYDNKELNEEIETLKLTYVNKDLITDHRIVEQFHVFKGNEPIFKYMEGITIQLHIPKSVSMSGLMQYCQRDNYGFRSKYKEFASYRIFSIYTQHDLDNWNIRLVRK